MPYVQRDGLSNIIGTYGALQAGIAEEFLADNNAAVIAFLTTQSAKTLKCSDFLKRWTTAEYRLVLANKATAASGGSMAIAKNWDVIMALGYMDPLSPFVQQLKTDILAASPTILTPARADVIFS